MARTILAREIVIIVMAHQFARCREKSLFSYALACLLACSHILQVFVFGTGMRHIWLLSYVSIVVQRRIRALLRGAHCGRRQHGRGESGRGIVMRLLRA